MLRTACKNNNEEKVQSSFVPFCDEDREFNNTQSDYLLQNVEESDSLHKLLTSVKEKTLSQNHSHQYIGQHREASSDFSEDTSSLDLTSFANQLQSIQESQDAVLADIRLDLEQLEMENLELRQRNAKLIAERSHWETLYYDMCKSARAMKEHITEIKKLDSSAHLRMSRSATKVEFAQLPKSNKTEHDLSPSLSTCSDQIETRTKANRGRSRRRSSSRGSRSICTTTEDLPAESHHRSARRRRTSASSNKSLDTLSQSECDTPGKNSKDTTKQGCFHWFLRRKH